MYAPDRVHQEARGHIEKIEHIAEEYPRRAHNAADLLIGQPELETRLEHLWPLVVTLPTTPTTSPT